jgi:hypothetical protein
VTRRLTGWGTRQKWPNAVFMAQVCEDENGCWIWMGPRLRSASGQYGSTSMGGRTVSAHRAAWLLFRGPIPTGLEIDHLCRVTRCCNPLHLEPVTHRENVRRGMGLAGINARKTRCIRGHAFDQANTIIQYDGKRACRTCVNASQARRRAAHVAAEAS